MPPPPPPRSLKAIVAVLIFASFGARAHDSVESPHLSCELDTDTHLICLYNRHPVSGYEEDRQGFDHRYHERNPRVGYADKGRYAFQCAPGAGNSSRDHRTHICRAGTGTTHSFQCWTKEARDAWLETEPTVWVSGIQEPAYVSYREEVTGEYVFDGKSWQDLLFKFLAHPQTAGRSHFLADDGMTASSIEAYASACDLDTEGGVTLEVLRALVPLWDLLDKNW